MTAAPGNPLFVRAKPPVSLQPTTAAAAALALQHKPNLPSGHLNTASRCQDPLETKRKDQSGWSSDQGHAPASRQSRPHRVKGSHEPYVPRNASRLFSSSVLLSSHSATSPGERVILQPENFSIQGTDTKGPRREDGGAEGQFAGCRGRGLNPKTAGRLGGWKGNCDPPSNAASVASVSHNRGRGRSLEG